MYRDLGHNWNGHQISGKIHWKKSTSHRQKVRLPNSGITNLETRSILLFYFVQCANMQVLEGCALPSKKRLITEIKYINVHFATSFGRPVLWPVHIFPIHCTNCPVFANMFCMYCLQCVFRSIFIHIFKSRQIMKCSLIRTWDKASTTLYKKS